MKVVLILMLAMGCAPGAEPACRALLLESFPRLDSDSSGSLSLEEMDKALADPSLKGSHAAAVAALRRAARAKLKPLPAPVTREAIAKPDPDNAGAKLESHYASALKRIRETPRDLFTNRAPSLADIHQGRVGDCFCLAPLGGWVHRDGDSVRALFRARDGQVEVHACGRWIAVPALTDGEIAILATTTGGGTWINYYEKAMGLARQQADTKKSASPVAAINRGGSAGTAMQALTGSETIRFSCSPFRQTALKPERSGMLLDELRIRLAHNKASRQLACAGTGTTGVKVPGILGNHAYAVLDYDPMADRVTIWNPHGNSFTPKGKPGITTGYPTKNGVFSMSTAEAVVVFTGFSFETGSPAGPTRP